MRDTPTVKRRNGESGQVLILAIVAMILVVIAALILFDVHTVIRGKVKAQNGVDAAALTAAEWQKHSLNVIGDLNLVRATGALLSDPFFRSAVLDNPNSNDGELFADLRNPRGRISLENLDYTKLENPRRYLYDNGEPREELFDELMDEIVRIEKEKRLLMATDRLVSQMQTRISFVGPLIAFGAAQQAAKNNGLRYDEKAGATYYMYRTLLFRRMPEDLKSEPDLIATAEDGEEENPMAVNEEVNGYYWCGPYIRMLDAIFAMGRVESATEESSNARGIAAGTSFTFSGMPRLGANSWAKRWFLGRSETYYDILNRNWRALEPLLNDSYTENWWNSLSSEIHQEYVAQSDILPLHIEFASSDIARYADYPQEAYDEAVKAGAFDSFTKEKLFGDYFDDVDPLGYDVTVDAPPPVKLPGGKRYKETRIQVSPYWNSEGRPYFLYNDEDADECYDLMPLLSWALFDDDWEVYSDDKTEMWEESLFQRQFRTGMNYQSGARAYFHTEQDTSTLTGTLARPKKQTDGVKNPLLGGDNSAEEYNANLGEVFAGTWMGFEAAGVSEALYQYSDDDSLWQNSTFPAPFSWGRKRFRNQAVPEIQTTALAKPLGTLKVKDGGVSVDRPPFEAGRLILPVFEDTALIPISLEPVEGISSEGQSSYDLAWLYYMYDFVPELGESSTLPEAFARAASKHPERLGDYFPFFQALRLLDDPNFRQQGLDWLADHPEPPKPGNGWGGQHEETGNQYSGLKLH